MIRKGKMAHLRKHFGKWQAVIQKKKIRVAKSFTNKSDARKWSHKVEALIETGSYFGVVETEKLNEIKVNELLDVYFDSFRVFRKIIISKNIIGKFSIPFSIC